LIEITDHFGLPNEPAIQVHEMRLGALKEVNNLSEIPPLPIKHASPFSSNFRLMCGRMSLPRWAMRFCGLSRLALGQLDGTNRRMDQRVVLGR
jgi:hypothetical protein